VSAVPVLGDRHDGITMEGIRVHIYMYIYTYIYKIYIFTHVYMYISMYVREESTRRASAVSRGKLSPLPTAVLRLRY